MPAGLRISRASLAARSQSCSRARISAPDFVLPLFKQTGVRVPQDVAFVDVFLEKGDGRFAGVRQNHAHVGAKAVELLAGQLQHNIYGVPKVQTTTFDEGTWFDGASRPDRRSN